VSFKDIIGQDRQIEIIRKALQNNRIPHAYLFNGEEGIGKNLTALNLAKALNCLVETVDACDSCVSCIKIANRNHPDVIFIEPDGSSIKIHQIRELQKSLQYKPYEGKKKVCIIPEAENMTTGAANCLLKTLEEPPPDTMLILTTTSPHLLLATVNSRCQRLKFQPLAGNLIAKIIEEKLGNQEVALKTASLARGNLKRAYKLAEGKTIEYRNKLIQKINTRSPSYISETFNLVEEMPKEKEEIIDVLELLKTWFRDILIFKEKHSMDRIINVDFKEKVRDIEERFTSMDLLNRLKIINDAQTALQRNSNKRLTLEVMLAKLHNN